jgi:cell division septum initiation protein DivIVA
MFERTCNALAESEIPMELQQLINQLEHIISQGKRVPLSQSIMVDEEAVRRVIDQMRVSVPDMIKQAERTLGERDRIIAQASEEAGRIIQLAREQATDMVEHHELAEAARKRANELLAEAEREAATMRAEADKYALASLASLAEQVTKVQREVENGMRALQES